MFTTSVLFAVLSILANLHPAAATQAAERDLSLLDGLSGGPDGDYHPTSGNPYGFGWFHPGAFNEGDRCWQNDREGTIGNALCIVAEINLGGGNTEPFNGWFDKPYYGYGHRFGWYHPGPYLNGDRCYEDGRDGYVQDALCVSVDTNSGSNGGLLKGLNLGRRNLWGPDYWQEPRFSPGHSFGWFHDGAFAEGDRCWSNGYYGSITDSLCVLAKLDLNLKRDDLSGGLTEILNGGGRSSYARGDRCYKNGSWGRWRANDCSIIDAAAAIGDANFAPSERFQDGDKCWRAGSWGVWSGSDCSLLDLALNIEHLARSVFDDHRFGYGVPCIKDGRQGFVQDTVCVIAEVDLNLRDHKDDVSNGVTTSFEDASHDPYYDEHEEDEDVSEAEEGSDEAAYDEAMEKRLLSYAPGANRGQALDKALSNLLEDIKTRRSLLNSGSNRGASGLPLIGSFQQLDQLDQLKGMTGGKAGGPLGGLGGGNLGGLGGLLGKRNHGGLGESRSRLEELMSSIGLARRSSPLDGLIEKLASDDGSKLLGGLNGIHKRLLGLDSLTGSLGKVSHDSRAKYALPKGKAGPHGKGKSSGIPDPRLIATPSLQ